MEMLGLILFSCAVVWLVFGGNSRRYPPYGNNPYYRNPDEEMYWRMYNDGKRREVNPLLATVVFVAALIVGLILINMKFK